MECRAVVNSLSDYLDNRNLLGVNEESENVDAHLINCSTCQNLKLELSEIKNAARELPLHAPPEALWTRISNLIEAESSTANTTNREAHKTESWLEWLNSRKFTFSLPQILSAAAFALVLIVAGISGIIGAKPAPLNFKDVQSALLLPEEDEIKADLERRMGAVNARKAQWDSERRADFDMRMNRIDESLKRCRYMLEDNPNDPTRQDMVRALYDEKRQLLEDVERLKW